MNCDFCSQDVIDKQEIFRGKFFRVLYPRTPVISRHFLLIPIRHFQYSHELNDGESIEFIQIQKTIFLKLKDEEDCCGYNLFTNNGEKAGQEINHCHFHFFARYLNEEVSPFSLLGKKQDEKSFSDNYKKSLTELRKIFKYIHD